MSDIQPREFGSAIQWNFTSVDTSSESWGKLFEGTEDPLRALAEEQRKWANQERNPAHETSEGINNQQAMADTVEYTFPWDVHSDTLLQPPYGANSVPSSFNGPEAGPSVLTAGSPPYLPSTSTTTHYTGSYIDQCLFGSQTEGSINRVTKAYTLPDILPSGAETSVASSASPPVTFTGGNLPLTHDGSRGVGIGHAMWAADAKAEDTERFLQWSAGADPYTPLGLMGCDPRLIMPFTLHEGYGPDPSQVFIPPTLQQSSRATDQAHHTGYRVMPAQIPASVSISTEVRNNSNNSENPNAKDISLSPIPSDAPTLQEEHGDDSQSPVEEQQENDDEVLPIIPKPSKETASLPCGFCVKKFSDLNSRNKHENLHSRTRGNQPSCPGCKRKLARLDAVVRHVRKRYETDRTNKCVVVALRRGWRYKVRGTGKHLLPGKGLA